MEFAGKILSVDRWHGGRRQSLTTIKVDFLAAMWRVGNQG